MKKAIFFGVFLMLAVPFVSSAALDTNLKYGSSGSAVTELQEFLTAENVYSGPISGNFYSLTLAGVKAYQTKEGIQPVSGYWGPLSRAKAQTEIDVTASDTEEQTETGAITTPTAPASDMQVFIKAYQEAMAQLQKQAQDQTSAIQQIAQNTIQVPKTGSDTPIIPVEAFKFTQSPTFSTTGSCLNCIYIQTNNPSKVTIYVDGNSYTSDGYFKDHYFLEYADSSMSATGNVNPNGGGIATAPLTLDPTIEHIFSMKNLTAIDSAGNTIIGYGSQDNVIIFTKMKQRQLDDRARGFYYPDSYYQ